jgi:carbamate kinase
MALGGNALLRRGEPLTEETQHRNISAVASVVAAVAAKHRVIVTHGNGPQVGLLAMESEASGEAAHFSLGVLGAETQGMIGFMLQVALRNALPDRSIATVLTSVLVDALDPALKQPDKFIGPTYDPEEAAQLARLRNWTLAMDGNKLRRVVPSPQPKAILELAAIRVLSEAGALVVCAGGGGVPIVRGPDGILQGVDAVVDKDRTSALLAESLDADRLLLLTDVENVMLRWGTPGATPIHDATVSELRSQQFPAGSMGPKVEAACQFAEATGNLAIIGAIEQAEAMLAKETGTRVHAN